jgi:uncharacterized membrane protein (DUF485 family)
MIERISTRIKLLRPLLIPFIIYILLLFYSMNWLESNSLSPWRFVVALLPIAPGIIIALGVVRAIFQLDELERKILLQGMAVSFACTFVMVLSLGLLGYAGAPQLNGIYIALVMALLWLVGKLWMTRRYS